MNCAVLVPNVSYPFFAEFMDCVEAELRYGIGYKMMLCNTVKESNAESEYLDMLNRSFFGYFGRTAYHAV